MRLYIDINAIKVIHQDPITLYAFKATHFIDVAFIYETFGKFISG
jgi:hypothetical protein